jgi:hypothetical protein
MAQTFGQFVEKERQRLGKARDEALRKVREAEAALEEIDRELAAIKAYEAAKAEKTVPVESRGRARRAVAARRKRPRARREEVLSFLRKHFPEGGSRAEILAEMNITGNKKEEGAVSQALSALAKAGDIVHEGKGRGSKYAPLTGDQTPSLHEGDF